MPARFTFLTVSALPWRSARSTQTAREGRSAAGRRTENRQKIQKITSKVPPARIVAYLPTEDQWVPDRRSSGYVGAFTATTGDLCVNGAPTRRWVLLGGSAPGCITQICTLQVGPLVLAPPKRMASGAQQQLVENYMGGLRTGGAHANVLLGCLHFPSRPGTIPQRSTCACVFAVATPIVGRISDSIPKWRLRPSDRQRQPADADSGRKCHRGTSEGRLQNDPRPHHTVAPPRVNRRHRPTQHRHTAKSERTKPSARAHQTTRRTVANLILV